MRSTTLPQSSDFAGSSAPEFYTRLARAYDALARRGPVVATLRRALADALDPDPGSTVVEFGCGTGANRPYVERRLGGDGTYVGVDFSPGVLRVARERDRNASRGRREDGAGDGDGPGTGAGGADAGVGHLVRGDATRPPLRAEAVDACCGAFVVGMLPDPAAAVREWADLVGPCGRIALLDLARTTRPGWQALNPAFDLFVRAGSPPGTAESLGRSPATVQDERVAAAHRALREVCADAEYRTLLGGFARVSAGTVERE
ncbi:class I SAM-dependent methyltransferase [Halobaculum gomorrense]|uniref:Methyltransferase domain-containing protein n=1 Tax=Halobaculum gomorrense TaxID=43928 RepID=A0A1M5JGR9_9EURY|nr:methyltransferase domain-containing protein [Halobaculum gomorrense]SHG39595.1 Methyltransferase domain-containing protein [Halobaculum gomorrense]